MTADTKWIIGTVIGTGIGIVTAVLTVAGILLAQIAGLNTRIADVNTRIDDVNTRIGDLRADVRELRADHVRFDERLRAVEIAFGKVDQRLLTIERVVLPPDAEE